jgi:hypothetical protein
VSGTKVEEAEYGLFCECAQADCMEQIAVPAEIFRSAVAQMNVFLVRAGHELQLERVLGGNGVYQLVHAA